MILSEVRGPLRELILDIQRRFDPRLASAVPPHVTITGSSGMGPIPASTSVEDLRRALEPVARAIQPMTLHFARPIRFMQTNVVVLPLDPNGPIRALHERIKGSGLRYEQPRFTFTPHVTLSFFRELTPDVARQLLAMRVTEPVTVDHISAYRTTDMISAVPVLELPLGEPGTRDGGHGTGSTTTAGTEKGTG